MTGKLRVHNLTVSLDGYAAGPGQDLAHPLGVGGEQLHSWAFATRTFRRMFGQKGGAEGLDDGFAAAGDVGIGATIMGRNMFGPIRGPWTGNPEQPDEEWRGWWGEDPPYHHPVFVLTHHPREPLTMQGGTRFHFVTDGIESALRQGMDAAAGQDVRIGGGPDTIRQYLRAGLVDQLHVAIVPILLGAGEPLLPGLGTGAVDGYRCVELVSTPAAVHVRLERAS